METTDTSRCAWPRPGTKAADLYPDDVPDETKRRRNNELLDIQNAISWEDKFEFDVWYVDNQSFWLDIKILWLTLIKVFISLAPHCGLLRGFKRQKN